MSKNKARIIAIINQKGGTGKTTLTINIGRWLQNQGRSVIAIDTDDQDSLLDWHADNNGTILPVVGMNNWRTLKKDIDNVSGNYDYVIIDGRGAVEEATGAALMCAHFALVPLKPYAADLRSTAKILRLINEADLYRDRKLMVAFLITECVKNTLALKNIDASFDGLEYPLIEARMHHSQDYPTAFAKSGSTVFDIKPGGKAARDISEISKEIMRLTKWQ